LIYSILVIFIPLLTIVKGIVSAYAWYWGNGGIRTQEDTEETHFYLFMDWVGIVLIVGVAMLGGIFGLYRLIDIVLLLIYAVLQFNFFYEGAMFSRWNTLDPNVHASRWKSVGTNPDAINFKYSTRWMMFVFSIFSLIILFTYHII